MDQWKHVFLIDSVLKDVYKLTLDRDSNSES